MKIIAGSHCKNLSELVAGILKTTLIKPHISHFPNGESKVDLSEDIKDQHIFIIQSTPTNEAFMELFLLISHVQRLKPKALTLVFSYLGYMRQDSLKDTSIKCIASILCALGVNHIAVVDIHSIKAAKAFPRLYLTYIRLKFLLRISEFLAR